MSHHSNVFGNMVEFDALAQSISAKLGCETSLISVVNVDALVALGYSGDHQAVEGRSFQLRDTMCARTVRAGKPLRVVNAQSEAWTQDIPAVDALGIGAYLGVPLKIEGKGVVGAVCAISTSPRIWQDSEVDYLIAVSDLVESKIERHLLRYEQKALSAALEENDAILNMLSEMEGKAMTVHNANGELVFASSAMLKNLRLNMQEMLTLTQVARQLEFEMAGHGGVDVALPVPQQTALNVQVAASKNGLTLAEWSRKSAD